jgi:hypothetical protein
MKIGRLMMIVGVALGAFVAFWLLSQRRIPTLRVSFVLGRGREISLDWIELD